MANSRVRVLDNTSLVPGTRTISYGPGCGTTPSTYLGHRIGTYLWMQDVVTPNFKDLSAKGVIVNSPMSRLKSTFSGSKTGSQHTLSGFNCTTDVGAWKDDYTDLLGHKTSPHALLGPEPMLSAASLITDVSTRARSNVKNPSVQGLAFIGEIQQTLNLLANPLSAMTNLLKQGKLTQSKVSGAASSQYLAYSFGLLPLMHDIEGLLKALEKAVSERETARAQATDSTTATLNNVKFFEGSALTACYLRQITVEQLDVRAGSMYAFSGRAITDSLGLSLRDIPAAIWELTPWSFVFDWITNVGNIINALAASCSNEFLAEWVTIKRTISVNRQVTSTSANNGANWFITRSCSDWDQAVYETYDRVPQNLGANIGFVLNLSLNKVPVLSALSLLTQQLTKRK